jgi:RNase adapter protein RapZ
VAAYLEHVGRFLESWLENIEAANRSYLTVAIGCTGGRHRSVYLAERLARRFQESYPTVTVRHTGREQLALEDTSAPQAR